LRPFCAAHAGARRRGGPALRGCSTRGRRGGSRRGAFERALDTWTAEHGTGALDLAAAYAYDLETMIAGAHAELRSRGRTHPRLAVPPTGPPPSYRPLLAAASAAAAALHARPATARG
jgi:hypothetical protein